MDTAAGILSACYTSPGKQVEVFLLTVGDREGRKATASQPAGLLDQHDVRLNIPLATGLSLLLRLNCFSKK